MMQDARIKHVNHKHVCNFKHDAIYTIMICKMQNIYNAMKENYASIVSQHLPLCFIINQAQKEHELEHALCHN